MSQKLNELNIRTDELIILYLFFGSSNLYIFFKAERDFDKIVQYIVFGN